jgi:hypothetical protein
VLLLDRAQGAQRGQVRFELRLFPGRGQVVDTGVKGLPGVGDRIELRGVRFRLVG